MFGIIPFAEDENTFIFHSNHATNTWQPWVKPNGIKFVQIVCIGGGGGGGRPTVNSGSGGGGGGSGGLTSVIYEAKTLDDLLYVQPGLGGPGATTTGSTGTAGNLSVVSRTIGTAAPQRIVSATGGSAGTAGAGGAAGTISGTANIPLATGGQSFYVAGVVGSTGIGAVSQTAYAAGILTGGAGGGTGINVTGGSIIGAYNLPTISGGVGATTIAAGKGADGIWLWKPMAGTGGAGGGGVSTGTGGLGGNGAYGCGGGGGGGAATGGTTGNGGNGGSGLVIISCW
jgi:hypothetical protein